MNKDLEMENIIEAYKDFRAEKLRLIQICKEKMLEYAEKIDIYTEELDRKLKATNIRVAELIKFDDMKETKTQFSYSLPSAKIVIKKDSASFILAENYNEEEIPDRFLETKKSVKWGDFKKILEISGDKAINTQTGEIVSSVLVEKKLGGQLEIKLT